MPELQMLRFTIRNRRPWSAQMQHVNSVLDSFGLFWLDNYEQRAKHFLAKFLTANGSSFTFRNRVVGRKAQNVRICACPGRDRGIEENAEAKRRERDPTFNSSETQVLPIRISTPNMTPPPTPQVISAPHSPPTEGPSTSAGSTEEVNKTPIPRLTKKRCEYADCFFIPDLIRQKWTKA